MENFQEVAMAEAARLWKIFVEYDGERFSIDDAPIITRLDQFTPSTFPYERINQKNIFAFWLDPRVLLAGIVIYIAGIFILPPIFRGIGITGKSVFTKMFVVIHSALLAIFSAIVCVCCIRSIISHTKEFGYYETYCNSNTQLWVHGTGLWYAWYYVSKYWEFVDTLILIIKQKPVSFLQSFHHAGVAIICWGFMVCEDSSFYHMVILNTGIHTLMYTYFTFAALGYRSSLKKYLTQMQLIQFIIGILSTVPVLIIPGCADFFTQKVVVLSAQTFAVILIALFADFYRRSYKNAAAKKSGKKTN